MAVERYTVGKNAYNKRERISVGMGAEDADALREVLSGPWAIAEARLEPAVQWAKATLERKGMPLDPNAWCYAEEAWRRKNERCSAEWYAITILHNADWLRRMIEKGDARMAADFALDLGELVTEGHFILEAFAGTARLGGKKKAENALSAVEQRHAGWRVEADRHWGKPARRKWGARAIAKLIDPGKVETIRKVIAGRKPR